MKHFAFSLVVAVIYIAAVADTRAQALSMTSLGLDTYSTDRQWLALLHYEKVNDQQGRADGWPGDNASYIDDVKFFVSETGHKDPRRELQATIEAFVSDPQVQCRYPARKKWLLHIKPQWRAALPEADCQDYRQWRKIINADKVVLVFASSYLNSPSSMYGHTFLRFDPEDIEQGSTLLSYALNFGARIEDDNGLLYAFRGLAGGYEGFFAASPYFEKIKQYNRLDNRNLWEYSLNLDDTQIDFLMAHIWELRDISFDYYFFDENCSYRLLELLDVAVADANLAEQFYAVTIPIDTVRVVEKADMVTGVHYRSSSQAVLQQHLRGLNGGERDWVLKLSRDITVRDEPEFKQLSDDKQRQLAYASYKYLRYSTNRDQRDEATASRSFELLRMIRTRPDADMQAAKDVAIPVHPDDAHETAMFSVGTGVEDDDVYVDLSLRLSYHDLLDAGAGYPEYSSLNMGRFDVRIKEGESVQLQQLDVIEITSLVPRDEFFKPISWRVRGGLERQWSDAEKDELVAHINGGGGVSYQLSQQAYAFGLLTARGEYNDSFNHNWDVAPGVSMGVHVETSLGRSLLSLDHYRFLDKVDRNSLSIGHNWSFAKDQAMRIEFKRVINDSDAINEAKVSYRHYF